jgi:hypothetical protein
MNWIRGIFYLNKMIDIQTCKWAKIEICFNFWSFSWNLFKLKIHFYLIILNLTLKKYRINFILLKFKFNICLYYWEIVWIFGRYFTKLFFIAIFRPIITFKVINYRKYIWIFMTPYLLFKIYCALIYTRLT